MSDCSYILHFFMQTPIKPQRFKSTLVYKEKVSCKVWEARLALREPTEISFYPGHNVMFYVGPNINRSMSIGSPPSETKQLTFYYDVSPLGPGSRWMINLNIGDTVDFMGPIGAFRFNSDSPRTKVLIATGTGIAPFRAMVLDYLYKGGKEKVIIYWGLRYQEDIFLTQEFYDLQERFPNFRVELTLSKPLDSWSGRKGRVTDHVYTDISDLSHCEYYLCGSKSMIDDVHNGLVSRSVPEQQIYKELFY